MIIIKIEEILILKNKRITNNDATLFIYFTLYIYFKFFKLINVRYVT